MVDWPYYNELLVRRGQILLDFDAVDRWDHELSKMNRGKVGERNRRNMSVIRQQTNLKRWKRSVSYGHRWISETVFSSIKRTFGEHVAARKYPHMVKEILLKATLYNISNHMI